MVTEHYHSTANSINKSEAIDRFSPFQKCILLLTLQLPSNSYGTKHFAKIGHICEGSGSLKAGMNPGFWWILDGLYLKNY